MIDYGKILKEIRIQQWNFEGSRHREPTAIVIHPDFYFGVTIQIRPNDKARLFGMEINLSTSIKPNEFIIGERFEVEE